MAKLPSKVFHSVAEFEAEAENAAKNAMQSTINYFKKMLWQFAQDAIYLNAYTRKWYVRTNWLKDENAIETYMYKNMKNTWGGGVRFNKSAYDSINRDTFQHGNTADYLEMGSYLEIMNDSSKLHDNPWHFPTKRKIDRGHFYDDFLKELDDPQYGFIPVYEAFFDAYMKQQTTNKPIIPRIPKRNSNISSTGALSSSTRQYQSLDTSRM